MAQSAKILELGYSFFMQRALELAHAAEQAGEVPVGAVLCGSNGEILAEAHNQPIARNDPTAHAEILAIREAAERIGNYRLKGTTLYVTLEPCPMCAAAMVQARIERVLFGAFDPNMGAAGSVWNLLDGSILNHTVEVTSGVCQKECKALLQSFFQRKRGSRVIHLSPFSRGEVPKSG